MTKKVGRPKGKASYGGRLAVTSEEPVWFMRFTAKREAALQEAAELLETEYRAKLEVWQPGQPGRKVEAPVDPRWRSLLEIGVFRTISDVAKFLGESDMQVGRWAKGSHAPEQDKAVIKVRALFRALNLGAQSPV